MLSLSFALRTQILIRQEILLILLPRLNFSLNPSVNTEPNANNLLTLYCLHKLFICSLYGVKKIISFFCTNAKLHNNLKKSFFILLNTLFLYISSSLLFVLLIVNVPLGLNITVSLAKLPLL